MPLRHELARLVRQRCDEIGLSAQRLALLAGQRLEVVQALLDATGGDLAIADAESIANAVGLALGVLGSGNAMAGREEYNAAAVAARTASTSFMKVIPPETLLQAIASGVPSSEYRPHIRALLEEGSIRLLAQLAYEVRDRHGTPASETWQSMRSMALALGCIRPIWH